MWRIGKAVVITLCLLFTTSFAVQAGISLFIGPTQITGIAEPLAKGGSLLVPAELIRHAGADIISETAKSIHFRINRNDVIIYADSNHATVNGADYVMGSAAVTQLGVLFVPLNFLADMLSMRVSWDQADSALHLNAKQLETKTPAPTLGSIKPIVLEHPPGNTAVSATMIPVLPSVITAPVPMPLPNSELTSAANEVAGQGAGGNTAQVTLPSAPVKSDSGMSVVPDFSHTDSVAGVTEKPPILETTHILDTFRGTPAKHIWPGEANTELTMYAAPEAHAPQFVLEGIKEEQLTVGYLPAPHRLVIDVDGFMPNTGLEPWVVAFHNVIRVRVAPFKGKGRIVLDLNAATSYQVEPHRDGVIIRLNRLLSQVEFLPMALGGHLKLGLPADTPFQAYLLSHPDRWVVDLPRTTLTGGTRQISAELGPVKSVRVSQFDALTTRIVFDMVGEASMPSGVSQETLELALHSQVNNISMLDLDAGRQLIVIEGSGALQGSVFTLQQPNRVVIDLENCWSPNYFGEASVNRGFIQTLRAAQFQPSVFRIVANVEGRHRAHLLQLGPGKVGVLIESPTIVDSRIVVDAGHGGADPGAIGRTLGLRESDVNLAIATELAKLLGQAKAHVSLTRTSDSHLFLDQRPVLAKRFDPDIFVSIHSNSTLQEQSASGTETLYWNLQDESRMLAQSIQQELVAAVGTIDRGVKQQNLLVLRESTVPAVLVEVAFLSHSDDEAKLGDPAFQQLAAQGIYHGIVRFHESRSQTTVQQPYKLDPDWETKTTGSRIYLPIVAPPVEPVTVEATSAVRVPYIPNPSDYTAFSESVVRSKQLQSGMLP